MGEIFKDWKVMKKTFEEQCRVFLSGFRGYRDQSPEAKHHRLQEKSERLIRNLILDMISNEPLKKNDLTIYPPPR